jgi:hypothetical protein
MRAEKVEVSWDAKKSEWLVRIQSGEEVIRRHCRLPKNADEQALRSAAQSTLSEEGYEVDGTAVNITR